MRYCGSSTILASVVNNKNLIGLPSAIKIREKLMQVGWESFLLIVCGNDDGPPDRGFFSKSRRRCAMEAYVSGQDFFTTPRLQPILTEKFLL